MGEAAIPLLAVRRPRLHVSPLTALVAFTLALGVLSGYAGLRLHQLSAAQSDRTAATAAAQRLAISLTTISAGSSDQNVQQLLAATTGSLKDQIARSSDDLRQVLTTNRVTSTGSAVQTGLVDLTDDRATVLVAVDASIASAKGEPAERHYRMKASVNRVGDRWLVSDMEFVP